MRLKRPEAVRVLAGLAALLMLFLPVQPVFCAQITRVAVENYPDFADDLVFDGLDRTIAASIAYYEKLPASREFEFGPDTYTAAELAAGLQRFKEFVRTRPVPLELKRFFKKHARVYAFEEKKQQVRVLFTGYYEPVLAGSPRRSGKYPYPVYARPRDLVHVDLGAFDRQCGKSTVIGRNTGSRVVPYYDRRTIETTDVLESRADVIAWVADPVKRFFLHVQGSGRIVFESGRICRVNYDITNGRPYRSIGRYLIDKGKISREEMSMQAIGDYIRGHPDEMQEIFFYNPRYVFFKEAQDGPFGSLGVKLTPGRSVALDQEITPSGALLFVSAKRPVGDGTGGVDHWQAFSRFMCSQDTGSAIRGPGRADIFWGSGGYAELAAGHMKHRGRLYFLVINPDAKPPIPSR
ncbi:MAG: MltA domain-containing protein [Desulfobacterales bacterium]|nr:MltA domain-containing protein [Desulfobacterales bacterium]